METRTVKALVIGDGARTPSSLIQHLEERKCSCESAECYADAGSLLENTRYDLVLSPMRIGGSSVFNLMDRLKGSGTTVFYFVTMEQGCWWLPAMSRGQFSFGGSAFRPSEFLPILDRTIDEIRIDDELLAVEKSWAKHTHPMAREAQGSSEIAVTKQLERWNCAKT